MRLRRLLDYLPQSTYSRSLGATVAFRLIRVSGAARWSVTEDGLTITATVPGSTPITFPLSLYTVGGLATAIAALPGYAVETLDPELAGLSARILLPSSGDTGESNGNCLLAASDPLALFLAAWGEELSIADAARADMLAQLNLRTAEETWTDFWGGYFGVIRRTGEADYPYALRIIAEVLRPRVNKYALENAVSEVTGLPTTIYEPWQDLFRLSSSSRLSSSARLFDGAYWTYNSIDVRSDANIEDVKPIVLRNKAAGILAWFQQIIKVFEGSAESESMGAWWLDDHLFIAPQTSRGYRLSRDLILSGRRLLEMLNERLILMELDSPPGYSYAVDPVYDALGVRYSPRTSGNIPTTILYDPKAPAAAGSSPLPLNAGQYWPLSVLFALAYKASATSIFVETVPATVPSCDFVISRTAVDGQAAGTLPTVALGAVGGVITLGHSVSVNLPTVTVSAPSGNATGLGEGFAGGELRTLPIFAPTVSVRVTGFAAGPLPVVVANAPRGGATGEALGTGGIGIFSVDILPPGGGGESQSYFLFGDTLVDSEFFYQSPPSGWNPTSLFAGGWRGVVLDPSVLSSLYQSRSGTQPVTATGQMVGYIASQNGQSTPVVAPNDAARPRLAKTAGRYWINQDGIDDALRLTVTTPMGATCTVALATLSGASITSGVVINLTHDITGDFYAAVIINRLLSETETALLAAWLNEKADT